MKGSTIRVQVEADLRPGHGLTHDDIYQAVVETLTSWVAENRHWTLEPKDLPAEGHHTLLESCKLLTSPERFKTFPTAMEERLHRQGQRTPLYAQSP